MTRLPLVFAAVSLMGSGLLLAQTNPQSQSSPPPTSSYPSSTPSSPSSSSSQGAYSSTTPSRDDSMSNSAQLKSCISQARAQNPNLSEHAAKQTCKAQMKNGTPPR